MKKNSIIAILAAAILIAGIFTAGCTQTAGSSVSSTATNQQSSASNSPQYTPSNTPSSGSRQFSGQSFLTNETLLVAAAGKLGVAEQDLKNALNNTKNATSGRPDFAATAQQLGVTSQQLTDALGMHVNTSVHRQGGFNGSPQGTGS